MNTQYSPSARDPPHSTSRLTSPGRKGSFLRSAFGTTTFDVLRVYYPGVQARNPRMNCGPQTELKAGGHPLLYVIH